MATYARKKTRSPEMEAIVARIEEVRKSRGMDKQSFALKIGIRPQTYSNYVTGQCSDPSIQLLLGIRRELAVSADWLLGMP